MTARPEGPQAFPNGDPWHGGEPGMTLRDWFAGQALAANFNFGPQQSAAEYAHHCYNLADAMLAARQTE